MSQIDARTAYERLLAVLQDRVPWLFEQVVAEVGRGRELKASEISRGEMANRNRDLARLDLNRLTETDVAVVELSPEERLLALVRAVSVAIDAHNASTETLSDFAREYGVDHFEFASPFEDDGARMEGTRNATDGIDDRRAMFLVMDEGERSVSREAIDAVIEALEGSQ